MRSFLILFVILSVVSVSYAQSKTDKEAVAKACMGYLEGFYEGDPSKLASSLRADMTKYGFWKNKDGKYGDAGHMSFDQAINYAKGVKEKKQFPKPDVPKEVQVLDVSNNIASAKVTAWWGVDYLLLSKEGDKWMIEQVLWEGPLEK